MKKCVNCNTEYPDDVAFCSKCGSKLAEVGGSDGVCPACGASVAADAVFCPRCGQKLDGKRFCLNCGAELNSDADFCDKCGMRVKRIHPEKSEETTVKKTDARGFINKVVAFEGERRIIVNITVMVLAVVMLFVALFAPIKVSLAGVVSASNMEDATAIDIEYSSQSLFDIFAALGYVDLDAEDSKDFRKIKDIFEKCENKLAEASEELEDWKNRHTHATASEIQEKQIQIYAKYYSECNLFAYVFAYTTVGALDKLSGEQAEGALADMLNTQRDTAIMGFVVAVIVAVLQLVIAVTSLAFGIIAASNIAKKRGTGLFAFLTATLLAAGTGLVMLSLAPELAPGGAVFAIALTAAIAYLVCGTVSAVFKRKPVQGIVKRAIVAGLFLTAFFTLCSNMINITLDTITIIKQQNFSRTVEQSIKIGSPLGAALETLIMCMDLKSVGSLACEYSGLTIAGGIVALVLGIAAVIALLIGLWRSLARVANCNDERIDAFALAGTILLVMFAVITFTLGAVGEPPSIDNGMGFHCGITARAQVYVSLGFAAVAFLLGLLFPSNAKQNSISTISA